MRAAISRICNSERGARIVQWGKLISVTGLTQVLVQALGLISGILIIHLLSTKEYALYTIVNAMLGVMVLLTDSGIGEAVLSQGASVWQDKRRLGAVIVTGMDLRKRFAFLTLLVVVPVLTFMLLHHGATIYASILLIVSLIPSFFVALSGSLLETPPKLHQDIVPIQKNQILLNTTRLVLVCAALFVFRFAFVAVLAACIPQVWANFRLRKISSKYADRNQAPDPLIRINILKVVKRIFPATVYYSLSSQITTWLISVFGSTANLAQVGALNRLAVMLNLISVMFSTLVIPRFARLKPDRKLLLNRFLLIQFSLFIISVGIVGFVVLFPHTILFILGKRYQDLTAEIVIVMIASCITMIGGITYTSLLSRAWALHPAVLIGVNVVIQAVLIFIMDLTKIKNVLWFSVINNGIDMVLFQIYFLYKLFKEPKTEVT